MTYDKLMELVLNGKSVNARSKELGLGQRTLDRYIKGDNLPDCDVAIIFAEAAGLSIEEVVRTVAAKKAELRPERARSFLRPAMAAVLTLVVSVNLFLTAQNTQAAPLLRHSGSEGTSSLYYVKLDSHVMNCMETTFVVLTEIVS